MAHPPTDPLEGMIADGRVYSRPTTAFGAVIPFETDLELAYNFMLQKFTVIYLNNTEVRMRYGGYTDRASTQINNGIAAMTTYIVAQMYNRMRSVLERAAPNLRTERMNTRCPVSNSQEFPTWISSTISSIGQIHVLDGPTHRYAVPATAAARMQTYGRENPTVFNYSDYFNFISVLKEIGVAMSPVDHQSHTGSMFPTMDVAAGDNDYTFYATLHHTHYENEDFLRLALFTNALGQTPWPKVGLTVGYVDNEATLTALAAVAAPEGIPLGQAADSAGQPRALQWNVNYYGIQPAVAAQGEVPAKRRGMYVIGRGIDRRYQYIIAREVTQAEILQALTFRLFKKNV